MAFFLLCLSINIEPGAMAKPGNIACTMNLTTKLIQNEFSTNISWRNLQPFIVERHAPANGRGISTIIPTAGQNIKIKLNKQIIIQLEQMKLNEFNHQEQQIAFYHLNHEQQEKSSGNKSGELLQQLLNQDLSLLRQQMAYLKQPHLVPISQPSGKSHLSPGRLTFKRDAKANKQRSLGQIAQSTVVDGRKIDNWRARYSQKIEWQEATRLNAAADQSLWHCFRYWWRLRSNHVE